MKYRNATEALPHLLSKLMRKGDEVPSRNGSSRELLMQQITLTDTTRPYITTPGRKASLPAQIAEVMWLLAGRDDIGWLSHYLPRAPQFSDDGETWRGAYGPRIRGGDFDQLLFATEVLLQDPQSRRAVVSIYDPTRDSRPGKDIPCNDLLHFLIRDGALHTHVAVRSNDVMWGWSGINAFEWSVLTQVVASLTGTRPGSLTFSTSSLHLYEPHFAKAERILTETLDAENDLDGWGPPQLEQAPTLGRLDCVEHLDQLVQQWFDTERLIRERAMADDQLQAEIMLMTDYMLRSWLQVMYAYWTGDESVLASHYPGTDLLEAYRMSPVRQKPLVREVAALHREKNKVYGNSWRKRGEVFSILPNIGRKIDRLGIGGAGDTELDTYVDLTVYLVKYHVWLTVGEEESDSPDVIEDHLVQLDAQTPDTTPDVPQLVEDLKEEYELLLMLDGPEWQDDTVQVMAGKAWQLAREGNR